MKEFKVHRVGSWVEGGISKTEVALITFEVEEAAEAGQRAIQDFLDFHPDGKVTIHSVIRATESAFST